MVIPGSPADICPMRALLRYIRAITSPSCSQPTLPTERRWLKRRKVMVWTEEALREAGYRAADYSFRRGASPTDIKTLGRWNSECHVPALRESGTGSAYASP